MPVLTISPHWSRQNDINPKNLMLDDEGTLVIIDFNSCKPISHKFTFPDNGGIPFFFSGGASFRRRRTTSSALAWCASTSRRRVTRRGHWSGGKE